MHNISYSHLLPTSSCTGRHSARHLRHQGQQHLDSCFTHSQQTTSSHTTCPPTSSFSQGYLSSILPPVLTPSLTQAHLSRQPRTLSSAPAPSSYVSFPLGTASLPQAGFLVLRSCFVLPHSDEICQGPRLQLFLDQHHQRHSCLLLADSRRPLDLNSVHPATIVLCPGCSVHASRELTNTSVFFDLLHDESLLDSRLLSTLVFVYIESMRTDRTT